MNRSVYIAAILSGLFLGCQSKEPQEVLKSKLLAAVKDVDITSVSLETHTHNAEKYYRRPERLRPDSLRYDVKKTDSVTSPFSATVVFETEMSESILRSEYMVSEYGTQKGYGAIKLYDSRELAKNDNVSPPNDFTRRCEYLLFYAFTDGNWELKDVSCVKIYPINEENAKAIEMAQVLGSGNFNTLVEKRLILENGSNPNIHTKFSFTSSDMK